MLNTHFGICQTNAHDKLLLSMKILYLIYDIYNNLLLLF